MKIRRGVVVSVGVALMIGCATGVEFERTSATVYPPTEMVEVLQSAPTDVEYEEVGFATVRAATVSQGLVDRLVAEARTLGADAIVVTSESRGTAGAVSQNEVADVVTAGSRTVQVHVRALKYLH